MIFWWILKYHSRYLSQIPLETVLFPILTYLSGINKDHFQHRSKVINCQLLKTRKLWVSSRVLVFRLKKNRSTYLLFDALVISTLRKKIQPVRIQESRCLLDTLHPHRALRSYVPKRRYVQFLSSTVWAMPELIFFPRPYMRNSQANRGLSIEFESRLSTYIWRVL